jgi:hypothetical protein
MPVTGMPSVLILTTMVRQKPVLTTLVLVILPVLKLVTAEFLVPVTPQILVRLTVMVNVIIFKVTVAVALVAMLVQPVKLVMVVVTARRVFAIPIARVSAAVATVAAVPVLIPAVRVTTVLVAIPVYSADASVVVLRTKEIIFSSFIYE